nr:hypothetical protein Itr_chr01CG09150 [Ipomoea trifida]
MITGNKVVMGKGFRVDMLLKPSSKAEITLEMNQLGYYRFELSWMVENVNDQCKERE